jgi:hypothetical protein
MSLAIAKRTATDHSVVEPLLLRLMPHRDMFGVMMIFLDPIDMANMCIVCHELMQSSSFIKVRVQSMRARPRSKAWVSHHSVYVLLDGSPQPRVYAKFKKNLDYILKHEHDLCVDALREVNRDAPADAPGVVLSGSIILRAFLGICTLDAEGLWRGDIDMYAALVRKRSCLLHLFVSRHVPTHLCDCV